MLGLLSPAVSTAMLNSQQHCHVRKLDSFCFHRELFFYVSWEELQLLVHDKCGLCCAKKKKKKGGTSPNSCAHTFGENPEVLKMMFTGENGCQAPVRFARKMNSLLRHCMNPTDGR